VLDRAVLARGIHRLEDEQHGPSVLSVETLLQFAERLNARLQHFTSRRLVPALETAGIAGIDILQSKSATVADAVGPRKLASPFDHRLQFHDRALLARSSYCCRAGM
jgi:hypothetical protein